MKEDIKDNLKRIKIIANNALWFDDDSDYRSALWEILNVVNPKADEPLDFIDIDEAD